MNGLAGTKAFVTGATGFLGGELVRRLASEGVFLKALARRPNRDLYIKDIENVEIVMGNISDGEKMRELVQGCDIVFHVAAATSGKLDYQLETNVVGTRNMAIAAAEAKVRHFVHVSSIAVYGYMVRGLVTEDRPQKHKSVPYNMSKSQAEKALIEVSQEHDLSYSIVRPGMIFGPRSGLWTKTFFRWAKMKPTPFFGGIDGITMPIYVDDVVDMMLHVATHPKAAGEAFNCVIDPQPSLREFVGSYQQLAGHNHWFNIPIGLVKAFVPLADIALQLVGEPQDTSDLLSYLESDVHYSMAKARDLLDWQAQVSLQEGIQYCIPYLQEKGLL
jgi:nucleoside-diphosphate-sugar epimerase